MWIVLGYVKLCNSFNSGNSYNGLDQVLALLPPYEGKSILELGAGIGRFTGELAKKAGQILALDFIENVIKKVCILCLGEKNLNTCLQNDHLLN